MSEPTQISESRLKRLQEYGEKILKGVFHETARVVVFKDGELCEITFREYLTQKQNERSISQP